MQQTNKNNSGFSLIEVVVAVVIIAIILVAIAALSTKSLQISQMAITRQKAITYARQGIEAIRNQRVNDGSWPDFITDLINTEIPNIETTINGNTDGILVDCSSNPLNPTCPTPATCTNEITFTCSATWSDSKGPHTVSQTTKLTKWI